MSRLPANRFSLLRTAIAVAFVYCGSWARAHDLTASHTLVRLKPESVEIQIKIAADSAWPLVQELSPEAVFVREDFETVEKPLLLKFGQTLQEFTVDGKAAAPLRQDVRLAEDTFLFIFEYPRPPRGALALREHYLHKMPPEYGEHVRVFSGAGELLGSITLGGQLTECSLPPAVVNR